jgi:hypothetical protein
MNTKVEILLEGFVSTNIYFFFHSTRNVNLNLPEVALGSLIARRQ